MDPVGDLFERVVSLVGVAFQLLLVLLHGLVDQRAELLDLEDAQRLQTLLGHPGQVGRDLGREGIVFADGFFFLPREIREEKKLNDSCYA